MDSRFKVLIVEDHAIVRKCIHSLLQEQCDIEVVGEAADGDKAVSMAEELKPDVVLMDISLPDMSGIEATRRITEQDRGVKVLALTMYASEEYLYKMLSVGAAGYFVKGESSYELVCAVRTVHDGHVYLHETVAKRLVADYLKRSQLGYGSGGWEILSSLEIQILKLAAEGRGSQEIAELLDLSLSSVQTQRAQLMTRLGLRNLGEIVRYAVSRGLIGFDSQAALAPEHLDACDESSDSSLAYF